MYERIGKPGKGYTLEEGKKMAKRLEEAGVDAINVTSACYDTYNYWLEPTSFVPGWRAYLAKEIKSVVSIPVIAANFMRSPDQAEQQLEDGVQDFIGSARSFICDPYWVQKVEQGHPERIKRCIGCLNCMESMTYNAFKGTHGECALNPRVGLETKELLKRDGNGRKVIVVGAGVAGLMAAETLARRGFMVTVYDKNEKAGGQVITASTCLHKDKLYWAVEDLLANCKALDVELRLGVEVTAERLAEEAPYAVIVASGAVPVVPRSIKGVDLPHVFTAPEIIMGTKKIESKKVIVVGSGMTGLETTEVLNESGNTVTVVEMAKEVAPGTWFQLLDDEMSRIQPFGTEFKTGKRLMAIREDRVIVEDVDTSRLEEIPADAVVLSLGVRPETKLYHELKSRMERVSLVGDANGGGRIATATHEGQSLTLARNPRDFYELDKGSVVLPMECFDTPARQQVRHDPVKAKSFQNDRLPLTEEQVKAEAARCLGCGATIVDQNKCIGCGLCTTRCEFDAIHLCRDVPEASKMYRTEDKLKAIAPYAAKRAANIAIKRLK